MHLQLPVDIVAVAQILDWCDAVLFDGNHDSLLDENTRLAFDLLRDTFTRFVNSRSRFLALRRVSKKRSPNHA